MSLTFLAFLMSGIDGGEVVDVILDNKLVRFKLLRQMLEAPGIA